MKLKSSLIPAPRETLPGQGTFELTASTQIAVPSGDDEVRAIAEYFASLVGPATGFDLQIVDSPPRFPYIALVIDREMRGRRGSYALQVEPGRASIYASEHAGLFYGIQSLRQLLPAAIELGSSSRSVKWTIPAVKIADGPEYEYRGLLLDVGRFMFPVSFIKKLLDLMAFYKLNVFHWHLTEDWGWRLEVKRYPRLTEIGSIRAQSQLGYKKDLPWRFDGESYGGFYTREEVQEIVAHARSRYITVIPEIEMPGHTLAALAAYPEFGCTEGPYEVATDWMIKEDIFCAGKDEVFDFLEDVLLEVMELFPSEYIHIGGDEAPKVRWKACPRCRQRIEDEGLEDEHELQSYFIKRMERFVNAHGRRIIGWDEILEGGLAPNATLMAWHGIEEGITAARLGHDVIMTPRMFLYFDYYQSNPESEPLANVRYLPLELVYSFDPLPEELSEHAERVLGAQGCVWTEYIKTPELVEYMTFPRACALAEVTWTPKEKKDYNNFVSRLTGHYERLDGLNVNYFDVRNWSPVPTGNRHDAEEPRRPNVSSS